MTNIVIQANANSTIGVTLTSPTSNTDVGVNLLLQGQQIAISIPTTGTGQLLTSMGNYTASDSVWRLRNGTTSDVLGATINRYGGGFSGKYDLAANTDTFVFSPVKGTHTSSFGNKAQLSKLFSYGFPMLTTDNYSIIGAQGNDTLTGGSGNDTLTGLGGNDSLTGGIGADKFVFTNQGVDTVTDFNAGENDVFAIKSGSYINAPAANTAVVAGVVGTSGANVFVDTLSAISTVGSSNVHFAYDTTNNIFLYDANGDWGENNVTIANVALTGSVTSLNFAFV